MLTDVVRLYHTISYYQRLTRGKGTAHWRPTSPWRHTELWRRSHPMKMMWGQPRKAKCRKAFLSLFTMGWGYKKVDEEFEVWGNVLRDLCMFAVYPSDMTKTQVKINRVSFWRVIAKKTLFDLPWYLFLTYFLVTWIYFSTFWTNRNRHLCCHWYWNPAHRYCIWRWWYFSLVSWWHPTSTSITSGIDGCMRNNKDFLFQF